MYAIGIDVGGTDIKVLVVDESGEILDRATTLSFDGTIGEDGEPLWKSSVRNFVEEAQRKQGVRPASIGVAAPGLVAEDKRSIALMPGRLDGLVGLDWTTFLQFDHVVPVLNDAQAALFGERWRGAAADYLHAILLTLGTGVGGAILTDGWVMHGALGRAGHFGHVSVEESAEQSIVGAPGALELAIGNCTIRERSGGRFASTLALVEAHRAGDSFATAVWTKSVRTLARAIASFINILDPEAVIIGGGIARAASDLFELLGAELDTIEWRPYGRRVQIVPAALGEWAGALGAARHAFAYDAYF
jgi:glucokinase